ncbi:hypothetical protein Tco_0703838 [Tanacetum coccineum]|uniref:Reverse transcriptase domain-containing protein n=1 Tax=Tanacetum coccineum TaxID=301880 RepID=A0ABQ4Y0T3_9ASTR
MPPKRNGMSIVAIEKLITQRVDDALLDYEMNQNNGNGNNNGNGSHDLGSGSRRPLHNARGCTYKEFLNCQHLNFKRTKGAVGLAHWLEKMEFMFHISLLDSIQGNVTSSKPTRLQEAIEIANSLMDQKIHVFAARQANNKRRMEKNPRDDNVQQLPYKRQNIARVWEKKEYAGTLPLCNKCKYHHTRSCTTKCENCKRIVHQTKDFRSLATVTN